MALGNGLAVLIVEDEWLIGEQLASLAKALHFEVVGPAPRVAKALELLDDRLVHCAILDINLKAEKSYPVADELARRGIPFLFVTGYSQHDLPAAYATRLLLTKPVSENQLQRRLEQILKPKSPQGVS